MKKIGEELENLDSESEEAGKKKVERGNILQTLERKRRRALINWETAHYNKGKLYLLEKNYTKAIFFLEKALKAQKSLHSDVHFLLASAYDAKGEIFKAIKQYHTVLRKDSENASAYTNLAWLFLNRWPSRALAYAKRGIGLYYFSPKAHLTCGLAYLRMRKPKKAMDSFEIAITQSPKILPFVENQLFQFSANFYRKIWALSKISHLRKISENAIMRLKYSDESREELEEYTSKFPEIQQGEKKSISDSIVIVSGLPRSGTSLMMQMLKAGGLEILHSDNRIADESNPQGYYEHEKIKELGKNSSWFAKATKGKAAKVILQLLNFLPRQESYRLIVMQRDLDEIIQSQTKMFEREGKDSHSYVDRLKKTYAKQVRLSEQSLTKLQNCEACVVNYAEAVKNPLQTARRVNRFLDNSLNEEAMAAVVKENLYRERKGEKI